jgi:hypothetical protein
LGYIGVVADRIGAVITPPRISVKPAEKFFPAEAIAVEPAIVIAVEPPIVIAVESVIMIAVEPAPAMRSGIGEIWLTERGSAQQSSRKDSERPTGAPITVTVVLGVLHVSNIHCHRSSPFWLEWSQAERKLGNPGYVSISDRG